MKRVFFMFVAFLCLLPVLVNADSKVKVYIFEAGGCPACKAQIEYLKGLDSNGTKFEIVEKELYVDHIDWEMGKDYALGKKVAEAFVEVGFDNATYQATPFVVISDVYAASGANLQLESVINDVYEEGDKDIVKCFEDGKEDCLDHLKEDKTSASGNNGGVIAKTIICTLIVIVVYLIKSTLDTNKIIASSKRK